MNAIKISLVLFLLLSLNWHCGMDAEVHDLVIHGGNIYTMETPNHQPEAISIKSGTIQEIGDFKSIKKHIGKETQVIDLEGKTLLPGFIDGHSHFSFGLQIVNLADLNAPPVGDVSSFQDMISKLQDLKTDRNIKDGEWIMGWGYDQDQMTEKRHPNKYDLDEYFPDNPVFILHVSGHMAVGNSKALETVGISKETPDPAGGIIVRNSNSKEPSGLLLETATYFVRKYQPTVNSENIAQIFSDNQDFYAGHGITTAQDGLVTIEQYKVLREAADKGLLKIDIEALAAFNEVQKWLTDFKDDFGKSKNRLKLSGLKIVSDGSPQGKTAYFTNPYRTKVPGCVHLCTGVPVVQKDQLSQLISTTYSNGIQTFVHCNGDASIDMLLEAHEKHHQSWKGESEKPRTVIIHSQFVREDQLEKYATFDLIPSFFTNHAFFWGDVHLVNLGEERADFLSPLKSAIEKEITFTNHTDFFVTPLDQLFLTHTAVNRISRNGRVMGIEERVSPYEAIKAITINSAYQHQSENIKGSIKKGKMADLVILDQDPMTIDHSNIKDIEVIETIKEGVSIYKRISE